MTKPVVVAYDVGTSGVKAVVVDATGHVLGSRVRTYGLSTPRPDHVEQDIEAIVAELGAASREVIAAVGIDPADVAAVAVTAQMFSVVPVDAVGRPASADAVLARPALERRGGTDPPSGRTGRRLRPVRCGADREGHRPSDRVAGGT